MPKNKDLKRLARERMKKTGESYTIARAQILARRSQDGERLSEAELAELAGLSTDAVQRATHHDWTWWLETLDDAGCRDLEHREITRHLEATFDISAWWTQSVAVGYERIVGLREIGQRREGTYDANKSKTLPVPVATLYRAFTDDASRNAWLPDCEWSVRTATEPKSIRLDWPGDSLVNLWFVDKGPEKSSVQVQQQKLESKDEADLAKEEWGQRLDELRRWLASERNPGRTL